MLPTKLRREATGAPYKKLGKTTVDQSRLPPTPAASLFSPRKETLMDRVGVGLEFLEEAETELIHLKWWENLLRWQCRRILMTAAIEVRTVVMRQNRRKELANIRRWL
jgi:hypothetical protein